MARTVSVGLAVLLLLSSTPAVTSGQGTSAASISGVVRDTSGAVLPGVTVEASSPTLIEKARSTVTDSEGLYRITELRPGVYAVTFTLSGFSVFRSEGIELAPNFNASINAELRVGTLEETITVSGQTPLVDTQNATQSRVIARSLLDAVPTAKSMLSIAALMPAVVTPPNAQDVGGTKGEQSVRISVHGGRPTDQRLMIDGMSYNSLAVTGTGRGYYMNPLSVQETVIDIGSGGSAQYALGGAQVNAVPKDGGNSFNGAVFGAWTGHQLQSDNFTDELREAGLNRVNGVREWFDTNAAVGGPIIQDRLWFFTAHRRSGNTNRVAAVYRDANPDDYLFTPDLSRPLDPQEKLRSHLGRLTLQATTKDKFTILYDFQRNARDQLTGQLDRGTTAIEANSSYCNLDDLFQATWNRPHSTRLLFEGGWTINRFGFGNSFGSDLFLGDFEQCFPNYRPDRVAIADQGIGFTYNGTGNRSKSQSNQTNGRFSVSYVTGAHNFKTGVYFMASLQDRGYSDRNPVDAAGLPVSYTFRNQVPISLTQFVSPQYSARAMRPDLGLFVQDQWNITNRLTVSLGLRYDYIRAYSVASRREAGALFEAADFPMVDCLPCWHDLNPRVGVVYDPFGDGKSAIKVSLNRYVGAATTNYASNFAPANSSVNSTTRTWNDNFFPVGDPRRGNFLPDCDLKNTLTNNECGPMNNDSFGQQEVRETADPDWIKGWGKRDFNWQAAISMDRELFSGVAVGVGYYRTWFGNFTVDDNILVTPADYSPYCVTAPSDPRLPSDISGQQICGLYDLNPNRVGQVNIVRTLAKNFGKQTEVYNGADVNFAARLARGAMLSGGWNIGNAIQTGIVAGGSTSSRTNNCFVVDSPEQLYQCDVNNPYQSRFKVNGAIPLPWWGIQLAGVYQNLPGLNYGAAVSYSNAAIAPTLGRNLSGASAVTIQIIPPFEAFLENRINQFDARLSKVLRFNRARLQTNLDFYNLFNASTVVGVLNTYSLANNGATWLQPTQILDARMIKISAQLDF
jgi:outer membrane receptor protein involved in Fe transport